LISLFDPPGGKQGRRAIRPAIFGAVALASVVAVAGCGGSSAGSGSSSSSSQSSAFRKCLEEHGVTPPQGAGGGFGGGGSGATPHAQPTGSAASSFKQAIQACGGSGGFHGGSAG
jgi:hypothetical protein